MNAAASEFMAEIRVMTADDLSSVVSIENRAYDFPWSEKIFRDCLIAGYHAIVMQYQGAIHGYGLMSVAVEEAHLLNICVDPDIQMQGFGRLMLNYFLDRAVVLGARQMFLEVRPSNASARGMYESAGFNEIGLRKNYYRSDAGNEDAIVFAKELVC